MEIKENGFEFRGFRLGQRVRYEGEEYICVGLYRDGHIAINKHNYSHTLHESSCAYILRGYEKSYFNCVGKDAVEIIKEEKETVLEIESQEVFGKIAFRITKQNEEVLKRRGFDDNEIGVYSRQCIYFINNCKTLYIRGYDCESDNDFVTVSKEDFAIIQEKVRLINEKYGIPKTTPREDYAKLEEVPFVGGGNNWTVYYSNSSEEFYVTFYCQQDGSLNGTKYVSKEDAEAFCKKWNKKEGK